MIRVFQQMNVLFFNLSHSAKSYEHFFVKYWLFLSCPLTQHLISGKITKFLVENLFTSEVMRQKYNLTGGMENIPSYQFIFLNEV